MTQQVHSTPSRKNRTTVTEPVLFKDQSRTFTYPVNESVPNITRQSVALSAMELLISMWAHQRSHQPGTPGGTQPQGVLTYTFSDQEGGAQSLGYLSPGNWAEKTAHLTGIGAGQQRYIMPALTLWEADREQAPRSNQPTQYAVVVILDGVVDDFAQFTQWVAGLDENCQVLLFLVGMGEDNKSAIATYQEVQQAYPTRIKLYSLQRAELAEEIATTIIEATS